MSDDLTFGVRMDGGGSLASEAKTARDEIVNLTEATKKLSVSSKEYTEGVMGMGIAESNAKDRAWALANGYKEVDGQLTRVNETTKEATHINAGMTRELMVLGHEAMTGNFSRMPGTLMVLANRSGLAASGMLGLGLAIATPVAALGAMAVAVHAGTKEMEAMDNALAVTSGYAGLTRGGMEALAASMAASGQMTVGTSKEIVTALVASGRIGSEAIGAVARLTSDFARATGADIAKIAPEMVKLFSDPLKGAEELNKSMHFLTATDIEHIATLQRLGETQQAQLYLAQKLSDHMPKEEANVGLLTKAYRGLRDAVSGAWDGYMSLGKTASIEEQLLQKQKELADQQAAGNAVGIAMRKTELMALMDIYVAQQKVNTAKVDAAAANEKELAITNEIHKAKSYKITELEDTLKMLAAGTQTNLVLEREKEIRDQIAKLKKPADDGSKKLLDEAKRLDDEMTVQHEDAFSKWIEKWKAMEDKLIAAHLYGTKERERHEAAYTSFVNDEIAKRLAAAAAAAAKKKAADDAAAAKKKAADDAAAAAEAKHLATEVINENARIALINAAAGKQDNTAKAREEIRFRIELINSQKRYELLKLDHKLTQDEEEAHQAELDAIKARHANVQASIDFDMVKFGKALKNDEYVNAMTLAEKMSAGLAMHSRAAFNVNKAAGIANAVIHTYEAVAGVLKEFPGPMGWGLAAVQAAMGFAQVSAIQGTQFGGGGGGISSVGGGGGIPSLATTPGVPVSVQSNNSSTSPPALGQAALAPQQINLTIVGNEKSVFSYDQVVNQLIPMLGQAAGNGVNIKVTMV